MQLSSLVAAGRHDDLLGALQSWFSPLPSPPVFQNLTKEQADYCLSHMKPYLDSKGRELPSAFDFVEFTRSLFVN